MQYYLLATVRELAHSGQDVKSVIQSLQAHLLLSAYVFTEAGC